MSAEPKAPNWVKCRKCTHAWIGFYSPMCMTALSKLLKATHCPMCGASSQQITLDLLNKENKDARMHDD